MSFLRSLATDLRERQVLPAVVVLAVLAIGIPLYATEVLSKSSAPAVISTAPADTSPPDGLAPPIEELATVQTAPAQHSTVYKGAEPNPFRTSAPSAPSSASSSATTTAKPTTPATTTPAPTPTKPITPTTPVSKPKPKPKPAPVSLASDQAYQVDGVATYGSQKDTLDDLQRLTPLPANADFELVYLGVLKGGKRAVFLVTQSVGATLTSSKSVACVPDTSSCQVIELAAGQQLKLMPSSATPGVSKFTFKLSAIKGHTYSSKSAAAKARSSASTAGEQLVAASTASGLARFFYTVGIGALLYEPGVSLGATGATGATSSTGSTSSTGPTG